MVFSTLVSESMFSANGGMLRGRHFECWQLNRLIIQQKWNCFLSIVVGGMYIRYGQHLISNLMYEFVLQPILDKNFQTDNL